MKGNISFLQKGMIRLVIFFFVTIFSGSLFAQNPVTGKVTDNKGAPLKGVSVIIKGSTNGSNTGDDGSYSIIAPQNSTLVYSFVGFATKEISIGKKTVVDVSLEVYSAALDEVVVIGYGSQKKRISQAPSQALI
ncbi:MAG: carboxypeptidase-like regulatory domain-containing protein [Ferruginibacter sp.]